MKKSRIGKEVVTVERRAAERFVFTDSEIIVALVNYCKRQNPGLTDYDIAHCEFNKRNNELIYVTKLPSSPEDEEGSSGGESPTPPYRGALVRTPVDEET